MSTATRPQVQTGCEVEGCRYQGELRNGFCPQHYAESTGEVKPSAKTPPSYKPGERSLKTIIEDLSKPIHARHLKQKTKGGKAMEFIPWYNAVKYLDLYAPGWSYEIRSITPLGNQVAVVARISIVAAEGVVHREATGIEDEEVKGYGDATSNAESMALRRAASKFGLGLYLYNK